MKHMARTIAALIGLGVVVGGASPAFARSTSKATARSVVARVAFSLGSGQDIVDWNKELLAILNTPGAQPATIHPTRSYAIMHAAVYDAVVSITHADRPYMFKVKTNRNARPDAAADQAAHDTLLALYPSRQPALDQLLAQQLAALPSGPDTQEGIRVGQSAPTRMLAIRENDGSAVTPPPFVAPPLQPGNYQITPPNQPAPVFTNWGTITPFVLDSGDQFRPVPPPALTTVAWAQAITEVQTLGQDTSATRTPDETTIAKFWAPPIWNTWNEIADGQAMTRHTDLEGTAKMFAALNLTFADTVIAFYDAKYHYLFWRPITAIRAGTPDNPAVTADPTWNALANTAPDPSYPGAHSSISEAAATVLSAFFGNQVDLAVNSDALPGVARQFPSFQAIATEAGLSRIFAGQHTRIDHQAGLTLGASVAQFVLKHASLSNG
jgi:membrane-associated phospholipid phosphatase